MITVFISTHINMSLSHYLVITGGDVVYSIYRHDANAETAVNNLSIVMKYMTLDVRLWDRLDV